MHMADALLSPAVGGTMWAATAALIAYGARKLKESINDVIVPLMGVLGAFIFASQMINFTIPGTGSSGHLVGGMILAILLGPYAGFLTMASILTVQALFFADGGLLALGCNVFNMGFFPCFVLYPLVYRKIAPSGAPLQGRRIFWGSLAAAVLSLQLGAFGVVAETNLSGVSELPFGTFLLMMQPIHLVIGIVEGLVTAAVVRFVWKARPEIFDAPEQRGQGRSFPIRNVVLGFLIAAALIGGVLSWFASTNPEGLEWAMHRVTGKEELKGSETGIHGILSRLQEKIAVLPDYDFRKPPGEKEKAPEKVDAGLGGVNAGTSVSGLIGGAITLLLAGLVGLLLRKTSRKNR